MKTVDEVTRLSKAYYAIAGNGSGGCLHIVLDDGNVDAPCVEFCRQYAEKQGDDRGVALCDALLELKDRERHSVYCATHGFEDYDPSEDEYDATEDDS